MAASFTTLIGYNEELPVSLHHDVYPTIDPKDAFANRTYNGKVVLVTGASRGIGQEIAIAYSKAGANVAIAGRFQETLDKTAAAIRAAAPEAQVLSIPVDVRDSKAVEAVVQATLRRFGKLDILIANAGVLSNFGQKLGEKHPDQWWNTFEVNVRGVYNAVRSSLPALEETNGYIAVISSNAAQLRLPGSSDYSISKHTLGRLVEFIALEHPKLTVFSLHPGAILTQMATDSGIDFPDDMEFDTLQLPAATLLSLTSGRFNWLSGRYLSSNWDLGEVEKDWKERIQAGNELVSKLSIPK
ncbi:NAD-P-binding protein [Multifurca ochricompacta]|uniref:NAD-P-binding protein n=1 Tax=Multifurca ochricompacta TaxID=376703 RepID=A0AAD4M788_9AGAM|nr:NAD-P-binding protein [Multifurca ochricompacta]